MNLLTITKRGQFQYSVDFQDTPMQYQERRIAQLERKYPPAEYDHRWSEGVADGLYNGDPTSDATGEAA